MIARVPLHNPISCCIYLKFSALKLKKKKGKEKEECRKRREEKSLEKDNNTAADATIV